MVKELAIETKGLTKRFDRKIAVNNLDLQVFCGEVYGLIGPNGAGKTTLLRMLATAEEPTTGEIYINGQRLMRDHPNPHLKKQLGFLPDDFPVYDDLTVWDYLDYFARLYHLKEPTRSRRIYTGLDLVELGNKRNSLIVTLSRGMKQRLSLARTIIHEPFLLLLDEPVSGLDPIARQQFRQIIKSLGEAGMTIIISSHVLSDLQELCTSVGIMELGYLVESSSLSDLYERLGKQKILISTLGKIDQLIRELKKYPTVKSCTFLRESQELEVEFLGTEEESAILLRSLIQSDFPIKGFHVVQEDLESIFMKLQYKQAS